MRAIQRRADQRVHAGGDTDVADAALDLGLRDPRQQHAGVGDQVAAGLEPQLDAGQRALDLRRAPRRAARGRARGPRCDPARRSPPPTSTCFTSGKRFTRPTSTEPTWVQFSTSKTPLPACACRPRTLTSAQLCQARDFIEFFDRDAELRLRARGLHMVVMAAADAGVDAQEHALALEGIEPVLQHEQVVDGHVHAERQRRARIRRAARSSA